VSAYGVISDAMGTGNAILIVALLIVLLVAAVMAVARAALHTERVTARSGRTGRIAATGVTATWILCALVGAQLWPGVPVAAADAASTLAATSAQTALNIREQEAFERALQSDRLRSTPADDRLAGLEGKDVVIAFLESYGEVAVQESSFTAGVARVLEQGGAQLAGDGYSAQSAFLTSPTFGGVSWLAHATLQSGVWVDSQQKYDRLIASDRWTLTRAFEDAGWRTVAVVPSNTEPWAPGTAFYGYDATLDFRSMGYRGPAFSYARIPDQYTWKHFYDTELAGAHGPIMAEVDFVSSHTPWTPVPRLVPWSEIGDGSVFAPQPAEGLAPVDVWPDEQGVRRVYGQSVEYTLGAMFSFLHTYDQPNLVLVVLGDHQPARIVSGADAGRDVPITIISQDPAVFERIASWQWDAGVRPSPDAPIWRMDQFRDRFVDAFDR
ncbi:MAG: CDP-alcohol phosphatidyltransferase, partial [Microbacterium sp.]